MASRGVVAGGRAAGDGSEPTRRRPGSRGARRTRLMAGLPAQGPRIRPSHPSLASGSGSLAGVSGGDSRLAAHYGGASAVESHHTSHLRPPAGGTTNTLSVPRSGRACQLKYRDCRVPGLLRSYPLRALHPPPGSKQRVGPWEDKGRRLPHELGIRLCCRGTRAPMRAMYLRIRSGARGEQHAPRRQTPDSPLSALPLHGRVRALQAQDER